MPLPLTGLSDAGFSAPRGADFLAAVRADLLEELAAAGETTEIDFDHDIVFGILTAIIANRLGQVAEMLQAVYDAYSPDSATGVHLDTLGAIVGVPRLDATYSTVTLTLSGTIGTPIPAGKIVRGGGDDDKARWITQEDVVIGGGGTVSASARAEELGSIQAGAGDIDEIVTPVDGWTGVTNANAALAGRDLETDAAYRQRRTEAAQGLGSRSIAALRARLLELSYLNAAVVADNDTDAAAVIQGITIGAHSVAVVVHPSTITTAQREEVARTIYGHLSAGIGTVGTDVVATLIGGDGYEKTIRYDFAAAFNVDVAYTVVLDTGFVLADVQDALEAAVNDFFDALDVGEAVRVLDVLVVASTIDGILGATVLLNGAASDIVPNLDQYCVLDVFSVTT